MKYLMISSFLHLVPLYLLLTIRVTNANANNRNDDGNIHFSTNNRRRQHPERLLRQHLQLQRRILSNNGSDVNPSRYDKKVETTISLLENSASSIIAGGGDDGNISTIHVMQAGSISNVSNDISSSSSNSIDYDDVTMIDPNIVQAMKQRLTPKVLGIITTPSSSSGATSKALSPNQFLHLHHMKTAGTSIDHSIDCSRKRLKNDFDMIIPYVNVHECDEYVYAECLGIDPVYNAPDPGGNKCRQNVS